MVVITGGAVTIIVNDFVSLPTLLVAFTVKLNVPAVLGVPDITPAVESVKLLGKLPFSNDHVIGVVPVAVSVWLYDVVIMPLDNEVVVMVGGVGGGGGHVCH